MLVSLGLIGDLLPVELIIVGDIWCRHYSHRPRHCRINSVYKKLSVDLSIVDLNNVGINT